jgi:hypothetical protein
MFLGLSVITSLLGSIVYLKLNVWLFEMFPRNCENQGVNEHFSTLPGCIKHGISRLVANVTLLLKISGNLLKRFFSGLKYYVGL